RHGYGAAADCSGLSPAALRLRRSGAGRSRRRVNDPRIRVSTARKRTIASPANPSFARRGGFFPRSWGMPLMTDRIKHFLANTRDDGPRLVVDLEVVRDNYHAFARALPDTRVFYAVKANPAPEVLDLLARLGSCFDTASVVEIEQVLAAGATADRISFGNTIKKERDIARAYELGVRLFAIDCKAEVDKIARAAPAARVFCRFLFNCTGAEWPLSRKFGCDPEMAVDVLEHAQRCGLEPYGVSFHVGSQQRRTQAWDDALKSASVIFRACAERGINLSMVNLGGGFPAKYLKEIPAVETYGRSIFRALRKHFGNRIPETII